MWKNPSPYEQDTALLIDGANCYETMKKLRWSLDFASVLRHFKPQQAMYFTALPEKNINQPNNLFKMIDYLSFNGYTVISKPMKVFNNDGIMVPKGNMDIEIAVHMNKATRWAKNIILFTGDGDFTMAVKDAQDIGIRVTIVSANKMPPRAGGAFEPPLVADELRRQANTFIDLAEPEWRQRFEMTERRGDF